MFCFKFYSVATTLLFHVIAVHYSIHAIGQVSDVGGSVVVDITRDKCTTMILGRRASFTGPIVTHTADCAECDFRINKVPAQDYEEGALRPIYLISGAYPRQVREDRGDTWKAENLDDMPQRNDWAIIGQREIIGYIPQARHTYALIEGMYGIMNEHQLAIGESTCASKLFASPRGSNGGKALLEASELSQIALERCITARDAIQLMGNLAVEHGFYSAEWNSDTRYGKSLPEGEGGEALTVVDTREAWVFHIIPDNTGTSAIWVAQRVPDDHIAVVANTFIIREIDEKSDDFMFSTNIFEIAQEEGWWEPSFGPLNFLKTFVPQRYHPSYSHRRVWRIFSLAAPSVPLPPQTDAWAKDYPFSIRVDVPVSVETVMEWQRDHYEGTVYSTTEGLAAGPYGDPNRFDIGPSLNLTLDDAKKGEFQRTISLFRTSYAVVATSRAQVPDILSLVWICQYAPDMSSFFPFYVSTKTLPSPWRTGSFARYDPASAWWNHAVIGNYASRFYVFTISKIRDVQKDVFDSLAHSINVLESHLVLNQDNNSTVDLLTEFCLEKGNEVNDIWRSLLPYMFAHFRDGYVLSNLDKPEVSILPMFYPRWWLERVGFFDTPPNKDAEILFLPFHSHFTNYFQMIYFPALLLVIFFLGIAIGSSLSRNQVLAVSPNSGVLINFFSINNIFSKYSVHAKILVCLITVLVGESTAE